MTDSDAKGFCCIINSSVFFLKIWLEKEKKKNSEDNHYNFEVEFGESSVPCEKDLVSPNFP